MDALSCLLERRSVPAHLLGEPVPEGAELTEILATAMRAPDHGALTPWRFLMVRGAARERLGELFAAHQRRRDPAADAAALEKARAKPLRAPLLIGVWAEITPDHPKAPEIEQVVATAAAAQNVLNALHARGYGGILLTGGPCYDDIVKAALGLAPKDRMIGFIYAGTPAPGAPVKVRPEPARFVREWHGPVDAGNPEADGVAAAD